MSSAPVIAIVDDDDEVQASFPELLEVSGHASQSFASAAALLACRGTDDFASVITDVRMPGLDGLELRARLRAEGGAVAFPCTPVCDGALLETIARVLDRAGLRRWR